MKTVNFNGKKHTVTYRSSTGVYTRLSNGEREGQFGGEVYNIDGVDGYVAIVATSGRNGSCLRNTVTFIKESRYEEILELHDPYNEIPFHLEIMGVLGFY